MVWWFGLQAIVGISTIVLLVDAGLSKDEPYLIKLAFISAFCAIWIVGKAFDFVIYVQNRFRNQS